LLAKILETCSTRAFLVMSYGKGHSVDNGVAEKKSTPFEILEAISHSKVG